MLIINSEICCFSYNNTQPSDKVENVTNICKLKQECWRRRKKWLFLEKKEKKRREVIVIISDFFKHPLIGNRNSKQK